MNKKLLGIDNGGSDIKCALFDPEGRELACEAVKLPVSVPAPGFTERDPEEVWQANLMVIRRVLEETDCDPKEIAGIGITAYGNGLVFLNEKMDPVYPVIVSTDDRAADLVQRFKADGTERKLFPYTRQTLWSAQPAVLLP
ncbi:MAG: hypothetical protein IKF05_02910, partial [Erysipelotrichaceae bacterium]|nr:hypothetical protein [Erysipelotrichaceae bacterium]